MDTENHQHLWRLKHSMFLQCTPPSQWSFGGGGDCFCSERSVGADLSAEPKQSRVIVSFLLNRIRAQRCGGFSPPVNRTAGSRPSLPAGQPLTLAWVTELLRGLESYVRGKKERSAGCFCMFIVSLNRRELCFHPHLIFLLLAAQLRRCRCCETAVPRRMYPGLLINLITQTPRGTLASGSQAILV